MAIDHALAALSQHFSDVMRFLSPEQLVQLRGLVADLDGPRHDEAKAQIADLLAETLPERHPVTQALFEGDLSGPPTTESTMVTEALRREIEEALAAVQEPSAELRPGEAILRHVADRVLQAPALTANQVLDRGGDPDDPGLIRLEQPDGRPQWPAFQFDPAGGPRPVIRAVNDLLDASADPVAAADWWLSRNSWLGDQPSVLIGRIPDDHLVRAARAVGSED
jgi:hypothetical protein